jgi:predicted RNA-binding protein YlxR (DUF448 family)
MCGVCRQHKQKNELLRFVSINKILILDEKQKAQSRGLYVCRDCLPAAKKRRLFQRELGADNEQVDKLIDYCEKSG